jgi:tRNA(fMet)-specific endonuclease VapC
MSSPYLLDTNILVHLVRGDSTGEKIKARYTPYTRDPKPLICSVTDGELRSLSLQFSWGPQKMDKMNFALEYFGNVPIESKEVMEAYATIDFFSKSQGIKMGKNDVWIAAAAFTSGAQLITTDDDFDHLSPSFISVEKIELQ